MNNTMSDSYDWDELLDLIVENKLIPVIGKEIYSFQDNEENQHIEEYLSKKILEFYKSTEQTNLTLASTVSFLINEKRIKPKDITSKLQSFVKEINFNFPLLNELLEITNLNYFINTTIYNNLLEKKIGELRKQPVTSVNFSLTQLFQDSEDFDKMNEPFVFNVFGSLLKTIDPAMSEDSMLEFTGYFKEKMNNAPNILNVLKNKNLLIIGCTFPDWMVRFFLRILSNEPLTEWGTKRTIIVVNNQSDMRKARFEFLKSYDVVTYEGNTNDFIHELAGQWKKRTPADVKPKTVFLSYTVKDKEAVESLKKKIESIGNVSCWYDNREIVAGDNFDNMISKNIRNADLFIPLISANSLMHKDGYVQYEWVTAHNVNTFRKQDGNQDKFLMPIVIDDTNPYDINVPKYFAEISIGKVQGGDANEEFLMQIKKTLQLV